MLNIICISWQTQDRAGAVTATEHYSTNHGGYGVVCPHSSNPKEKHWKHPHVCRPFALELIHTMIAVHVTHPCRSNCWYCCSQCQILTVLDAMKGYHQCPLDQDSQRLTTFITPLGRLKYLRAPYGISSISEHYNRHMAKALADLSGFCRTVNDNHIW